MQTDLFQVHANENNSESQSHLEENRETFGKQCQDVFDLLMHNAILSSFSAMTEHGIGHLARRILDLKERGVLINDIWEIERKPKVKLWFMSKENQEFNKKFYKLKT